MTTSQAQHNTLSEITTRNSLIFIRKLKTHFESLIQSHSLDLATQVQMKYRLEMTFRAIHADHFNKHIQSTRNAIPVTLKDLSLVEEFADLARNLDLFEHDLTVNSQICERKRAQIAAEKTTTTLDATHPAARIPNSPKPRRGIGRTSAGTRTNSGKRARSLTPSRSEAGNTIRENKERLSQLMTRKNLLMKYRKTLGNNKTQPSFQACDKELLDSKINEVSQLFHQASHGPNNDILQETARAITAAENIKSKIEHSINAFNSKQAKAAKHANSVLTQLPPKPVKLTTTASTSARTTKATAGTSGLERHNNSSPFKRKYVSDQHIH